MRGWRAGSIIRQKIRSGGRDGTRASVSGRGSRKLAAVLMVALMLAVVAVPLVPDSHSNSAAVTDDDRTIVYTDPDSTTGNKDVTAVYDGIASTEYNPEFWSQHFVGRVNGGTPADWIGPEHTYTWPIAVSVSFPSAGTYDIVNSGNVRIVDIAGNGVVYTPEESGNGELRVDSGGQKSLMITYRLNKVFGGWFHPEDTDYSDLIWPGDVVNMGQGETTTLVPRWMVPTLVSKAADFKVEGLVLRFDARTYWYFDEYYTHGDFISGEGSVIVGPPDFGSKGPTSPFTNIVVFRSNTTFNGNGSIDKNASRIPSSLKPATNNQTYWLSTYPATYRSLDPDNPVTLTLDCSRVNLYNDTIIDNVNIKSPQANGSHGEAGNGLFAGCNVLVLGTNVGIPDISSRQEAPQVYGGWMNGNDNADDTKVIIHSGYYFNVVAGHRNNGLNASTNLVMRGGFVFDTVTGGNSSFNTDNASNVIKGDVNVWMLGDVFMTGDHYKESQYVKVGGSIPNELQALMNKETFAASMTESSILTGGSSGGKVQNTHVYVSNDACLWDAQAAGRKGYSTVVGTAAMEVSGNAVVRHAMCGSITDGINHMTDGVGDMKCVDHVVLTLRDNCRVGAVYGGGYDTFYNPKYSSMYGSGSTISVSIEDTPVVGNVFGGGYRGIIGTPGSPIGSLSVTINGGTILGNVYGGGSGGVDKVNHDSSGGLNGGTGSQARYNSTGYGKVYAEDVSVTIGEDAVVMGSVYGGGKSVPAIDNGGLGVNGYYGCEEVAALYADSLKVTINGHVEGDVFGAGQGIDWSSVNEGVYDGPGINVLVGDVLEWIDWYKGCNLQYAQAVPIGIDVSDAAKPTSIDPRGYMGYAKVGPLQNGLSVSVEIAGAVIDGSVFGAGRMGTLTGDTSVSITGTPVKGWVSGGGIGLSKSLTDDTGKNNSEGFGTVDGSISIDVGGGSSVGQSLFGGGQYGRIHGGSISIGLRGVTVNGDVFAGGYGEVDRLATNVAERSIVVDGAKIHGSLYGGSRAGNDNCDSNNGKMDTTGYDKGSVRISIVSGDFELGQSGNVYGGSYRGNSYMDVEILMGTPAGAAGGPIRVESVYGGASVGDPATQGTEGFLNEVHVIGDAYIEIGNSNGNRPSSVTVSGNVFGEGDFCSSEGTSTVVFDGFVQTGGMLSVQKADEVRLVGSTLTLDGNVDGTMAVESERLSVAHVGDLILQKSPISPSRLVLNAGVSDLGGYASFEADSGVSVDSVGSEPGSGTAPSAMNSILQNRGVVFSVMGEGNMGVGVGGIRGYTLIESDSRGYYGSLVIGETGAVSDQIGFYVRSGDSGVVPTTSSRYEYVPDAAEDGSTSGGIDATMWYISGAYKFESTIILQDDHDSTRNISESVSSWSPRLYSNSVISFSGGYVIQDTEGSLVLNEGLSATGSTPGKDFVVSVGTGGGENVLLFEGGPITALPGSPVESSNKGIILNMTVETLPKFRTTGYCGTVVMHMVEMVGNLAVNSFDVELSIYLRVDGDVQEIEHEILMPNDGGQGSTDVYIPVVESSLTNTYYIAAGYYDHKTETFQPGTIPGDLSVKTVSNNLNRNGWISANYRNDPLAGYSIENLTMDEMVELGTAGSVPPVVEFSYSYSPTLRTSDKDVHLVVKVEDESGTVRKVLNLTLLYRDATTNSVTFHDQYLSGGVWSGYESGTAGLTVDVPFESSLDRCWVAYDKAGFENWAVTVTAEQFVTGFQKENKFLFEMGGKVRVTADETQLRRDLLDHPGFATYEVVGFTDFLDIYLQVKSTTIGGYDYTGGEWYDGADCVTKVNFGIYANDDVGIYAGYPMKVDIVAISDYKHNEEVRMTLSIITGNKVDLTLLNQNLVPVGYTAADQPWCSDLSGTPMVNPKDYEPAGNGSVYFKIEVNKWGLKVDFTGTGAPTEVKYELDDGVVSTTSVVNYQQAVTVSFVYNGAVAVTSDPTVTVGYTRNGDSHTVTFAMPNSDLGIKIQLSEDSTTLHSLSVTVEFLKGGQKVDMPVTGGLTITGTKGPVAIELTRGSDGGYTGSVSLTYGTYVIGSGFADYTMVQGKEPFEFKEGVTSVAVVLEADSGILTFIHGGGENSLTWYYCDDLTVDGIVGSSFGSESGIWAVYGKRDLTDPKTLADGGTHLDKGWMTADNAYLKEVPRLSAGGTPEHRVVTVIIGEDHTSPTVVDLGEGYDLTGNTYRVPVGGDTAVIVCEGSSVTISFEGRMPGTGAFTVDTVDNVTVTVVVVADPDIPEWAAVVR